ncbi:hypothetical protein EJB05_14528, partial [Eragrostis curvula]
MVGSAVRKISPELMPDGTRNGGSRLRRTAVTRYEDGCSGVDETERKREALWLTSGKWSSSEFHAAQKKEGWGAPVRRDSSERRWRSVQGSPKAIDVPRTVLLSSKARKSIEKSCIPNGASCIVCGH